MYTKYNTIPTPKEVRTLKVHVLYVYIVIIGSALSCSTSKIKNSTGKTLIKSHLSIISSYLSSYFWNFFIHLSYSLFFFLVKLCLDYKNLFSSILTCIYVISYVNTSIFTLESLIHFHKRRSLFPSWYFKKLWI